MSADPPEMDAATKATVALAAIRGEQSVEALAQEFHVDPAQVEQWKAHLERFLGSAFAEADAGKTADRGVPVPPGNLSDPVTIPVGSSLQGSVDVAAGGGLQYRTLPDLPTLPLNGPDQGTGSGPQVDTPTAREELRFQLLALALESGLQTGERAHRMPQVSGWFGRLLGPVLAGWRESRQAKKTSQEMLAMYLAEEASTPNIADRDLYRRVLVRRLGGSVVAAEAVLRRAEESFASWPTKRPLKYRDIVHCLAVMEYLDSSAVANWTRKDFRHRVARYIPEDL